MIKKIMIGICLIIALFFIGMAFTYGLFAIIDYLEMVGNIRLYKAIAIGLVFAYVGGLFYILVNQMK